MPLMALGAVATDRQFRVPEESGRALVDPSLELVRSNLMARRPSDNWNGLEFCGHSMDALRSAARPEAVQLACRYTSRYLDTSLGGETGSEHGAATTPILLTGHQPELFHPGVWFKNFLLSQETALAGGVAINFLVDNDLCRTTSIRVPHRLRENSLIASAVPFDGARDSIPWEHRRLNDADCWKNFPTQVRNVLVEEAGNALVGKLWRYALEAITSDSRIGYAIAQARHRMEADYGLRTLEVPLSQLVSSQTFAQFSVQLLSELPRLQSVYNSQRETYRVIHRIRSQAHPVPALEQRHGWLEAPWWVYRPETPHRQRLWARLVNDALILSDQAGWQATIEGRLDSDSAAAQWLDLVRDGICLRPRALLTTMYLRLFVGDTFVHGIGGGKYDQLTDAIIREFFGIAPPEFVVASATMFLPFRQTIASQSSQAAQRRLWELKYHGEQLGDLQLDTPEFEQLVRRKQMLLQDIPPRGEKWKWHREITRINSSLAQFAKHETLATQQQLEQAQHDARQQRIVRSREYSFCLFDDEQLVPQLIRMASSLAP
jgi:hypothetical protein